MPFHHDQQNEAGPSTRPYIPPTSPSPACAWGLRCPYLAYPSWQMKSPSHITRPHSLQARQDIPSSSTSDTSIQSITPSPTSSSSSSTSQGLFAGPTYNITTLPTSTFIIPPGTDNYTFTDPTTLSSTSTYPCRPAVSTSTFSAPWTYTPTRPSRTSSGATPAQTSYVPGVILPLTLGGDSDDQAVYSVEMSFGHEVAGVTKRRRGYRGERGTATDWNGGDPQTMNLQVDLGSSDMWVASDTCLTTDCTSAPGLFNASASLDSDTSASLTYHSGSVSGEVYWEEIELGGFGIGYQAFLLASSVTNEDLGGGNFSGVLGLALPANSVIVTKIPGTTGSNPDGATFLDNLFGTGISAPTERLFSLSLERREDVRTSSSLGIGAVNSTLCPTPCNPKYIPIIAHPNLGAVGYLHWRIPIDSISATTWGNAQGGDGASTSTITLGPSLVDTAKTTPLAVLDSGGVAILVGYKQYVDNIYSAFGISASSDGLYRMPCTQQISLTFTLGGTAYPVHPLDMSWPDPDDPSQSTCVGAVQYSANLGETGDFILGSSFLKNVYSIFQYPDVNRTTANTWQPTIGLIPLTNASLASQDFYAVRTLHQSLSTVSRSHQLSTSDNSPSSPSSSSATANSPSSSHGVSTTVIAVTSVIGFFILASAIFSAWWFWLRRKFGENHAQAYPIIGGRRGHGSDASTSTLRSKKHDYTQRQRSMVEGYSDWESDDQWRSTTEGGDSIRLGYLPEVLEEEDGDEGRKVRGEVGEGEGEGMSAREKSVESGSGRSRMPLVDLSEKDSPSGGSIALPTLTPEKDRHGSTSDVPAPSTQKGEAGDSAPPKAYPYPTSASARSLSLSMAGPFPSAVRASIIRPDASPMYDIRTSDYFTVAPVVGSGSGRGRESRRVSGGGGERRDGSGSGSGSGSAGRRGSRGMLSGMVSEEPSEMLDGDGK